MTMAIEKALISVVIKLGGLLLRTAVNLKKSGRSGNEGKTEVPSAARNFAGPP